MSRLVAQETERYRRRMPESRRAETLDPIHNHLTRWLDRMLHLVDVVLEDEGVDRAIRQRVVRGILYGGPDAADAELRMAQQEQVARILETAPARMVVEFPPQAYPEDVARWRAEYERRGGEQQ